MADMINPFIQSVGRLFASRNQREYEKQMKINEDMLKSKEKYREAVGDERVCDIDDLWFLVEEIRAYINNQANPKLPKDQIKILLDLLKRIKIYEDGEKLHPYEIPALFHYKILISELEELIE